LIHTDYLSSYFEPISYALPSQPAILKTPQASSITYTYGRFFLPPAAQGPNWDKRKTTVITTCSISRTIASFKRSASASYSSAQSIARESGFGVARHLNRPKSAYFQPQEQEHLSRKPYHICPSPSNEDFAISSPAPVPGCPLCSPIPIIVMQSLQGSLCSCGKHMFDSLQTCQACSETR
jgi:hypothetical protein